MTSLDGWVVGLHECLGYTVQKGDIESSPMRANAGLIPVPATVLTKRARPCGAYSKAVLEGPRADRTSASRGPIFMEPHMYDFEHEYDFPDPPEADNDATFYRRPLRVKSQAANGPGPCPKCGGETVSRSGRFGAFYGCVNYPKCKGSRNL